MSPFSSGNGIRIVTEKAEGDHTALVPVWDGDYADGQTIDCSGQGQDGMPVCGPR